MKSFREFEDNWLAEALLYYNIIDQSFYEELCQRYLEEEYFFDILTKNSYLHENEIAVFVEDALKIPAVNLETIQIDKKLIRLIPEDICRKYLIIPFNIMEKQISIACFNTSDFEAEAEIERLTGKYVKPYFAFRNQISNKIDEFYAPESQTDSLTGYKNLHFAGEKSVEIKSQVVKIVDQIIGDAITQEASDIHIEPKEDIVLVRYRIDGILQKAHEFPKSIHPSLISRIKILSNLNIAETRKPQDGKAKVFVDDIDIDMRISALPANFGEKIVIRILDKRTALVSFPELGIRDHNLKLLQKAFDAKQGIVLVTGPTGSGKSTTLYAAINSIRSGKNNILTIENPIEYMIEGINQVQVNEKAGVTFATALRSFLRQDPDIILVGEIRDRETAEIAIRAALTGHLVLSTLHTNDTLATVTRLHDMGLDIYKITESLQAIVAQRLIRKLCPFCKHETQPDKLTTGVVPVMEKLGYNTKFFAAEGCKRCAYTGYKGRIGVYEILNLDGDIKDLIAANSSHPEIINAARNKGFRNLFEDALSLISEGITDVQEVSRVIDINAEKNKLLEIFEKHPKEKPSKLIKLSEKKTSPQIEIEQPSSPNTLKKLLIVEDDSIVRKMIRRTFEEKTGWQISEAGDGKIALKTLETEFPDVIILDVMMPNMNGYDFLDCIRQDQNLSSIPVLMLTSLNKQEDELDGLKHGADDFIKKPFNPKILFARINRLLTRVNYQRQKDRLTG